MHLLTIFAADQSTGIVIATVVFIAALAPLAAIPFTLAWSHKGLHGIYKKGRQLAGNFGNATKGAAGSAGKMATSGIKQDMQGKLASRYDPSKKPYAGSNLAIRAALGKLSPSRTATRQVVSAGSEYVQKQASDADKVLTAARLSKPGDQARIAAGGVATSATGGVIDSRRDPYMQRAQAQRIISSRNIDEFNELAKNPNANWNMINELLGDNKSSNYSDAVAMGAYAPDVVRAYTDPTRPAGTAIAKPEFEAIALKSMSGSSYKTVASQKPQALQIALEGAKTAAAIDPHDAQVLELARLANQGMRQSVASGDMKPGSLPILQELAKMGGYTVTPGPAGPPPAPPTSPAAMPTDPVTITRPPHVPPPSPGGGPTTTGP